MGTEKVADRQARMRAAATALRPAKGRAARRARRKSARRSSGRSARPAAASGAGRSAGRSRAPPSRTVSGAIVGARQRLALRKRVDRAQRLLRAVEARRMQRIADAGKIVADRLGLGGRRPENAEPAERPPGRAALRRALRASPLPPSAGAPALATIRRSMSTNSPDSGRLDQVVSAVTWKRTIRPLPRGPAVTSGVPSPSRAQTLSARAASGSASTCRETVTSSGAARPKNGLPASNGAICFGRLPGQRASEQTSASPQFARRQVVVARGQARARQIAAGRLPDRETGEWRRAPVRGRRSCRRARAPRAFPPAAKRWDRSTNHAIR